MASRHFTYTVYVSETNNKHKVLSNEAKNSIYKYVTFIDNLLWHDHRIVEDSDDCKTIHELGTNHNVKVNEYIKKLILKDVIIAD